jgi:nicotinate-nucleotide pyrophosphorylase (carboxylating)
LMSMPRELVKEKLLAFLKEDVGQGDITSQLVVPQDMLAEADVIAKGDGVVAGLEEAQILVEAMGLTCNLLVSDGASVKAGTALMHIEGNARDLLATERTLLNIVSRMSGIATKTRILQETAWKANPSVRVASTRKAAPGCLYFDKRAVAIGGGDSHRLHLDDLVLIKDNHKELAGSIREAVRRARTVSFTKKIEVEVTSGEEAIEAAESGADILMFDNMAPSSIKSVVQELEQRGMRKNLVLEASGGIDESNVSEFARSGVDILSLGSLTHSVKAFDVSLEIRGHGKK